MNRNQVIGGIIALVVVAGGAFYAGNTYAKSGAPERGQFTTFTAGAGGTVMFAGRGAATARTGGGFTAGTILSSSNGSITIEQQNGSSTGIVLISPSTQVFKQVAGSASDLKAGVGITVTGTTNSDGSVTASSIQIRPAGQPGMPMPVMRQ